MPKQLPPFGLEDGDYVDVNDRHLQGRSAIENAFKDFFMENKGLKLRIDVNSVRFLAPGDSLPKIPTCATESINSDTL